MHYKVLEKIIYKKIASRKRIREVRTMVFYVA